MSSSKTGLRAIELTGDGSWAWLRMLLACCAVFVLAVVANDPLGHRGFMPIDQSILFDGGWRLLTGQVPIRDFATPNGIVPAAIQAAMFRIGGVSWNSYVIHADILNGLFGITVLLVLRSVRGSLTLSLWYAAASVVVFQPPFGTPFVDQAGFFFGLVALALALAAGGGSTPLRQLAIAVVPLALTLSLLSKQIPAAMLAPLVVVACLARAHEIRRTARLLAIGTVVVATVLAWGVVAAGVPPGMIVEHLWTLPAEVGVARLDDAGARPWALLVPQWNLIAPATVLLGSATVVAIRHVRAGQGHRAVLAVAAVCAVVIGAAVVQPASSAPVRGAPAPGAVLQRLNAAAGYAVAAAAVAWLVLRLRRRHPDDAVTRSIDGAAALAVALVLVCCAFVAMTQNQIENGVPFAFLALGLLHIAVLTAYRTRVDGSCAVVASRSRRAWIAPMIGLLFAGITVVDVMTFQREVNGPRVVHDYRFDPAAATTVGRPAGFHVALHGPFAYTAADLGRITRLVREAGGPTIVFGDTTVIAALAGVESISPMLWLDPGLVFPRPGAPGFEAFDRRFASVTRRPDTATVVVEQAANPWWTDTTPPAGESWRSAQTWTGMRLSDFPNALHVIEERLCSADSAGPFTLLRLCL